MADGTTSITWTAVATGGAAPLEYQFWRYSFATGLWTLAQGYSPSSSYTWTPTPAESGTYALVVWVRSSGSTASYEAELGTLAFTIVGQPLAVSSLTADHSFPVATGPTVTWTAVASGGLPPLQYEFWLYSNAGGTWTLVQPYGVNNTFTWTPTAGQAGSYALVVFVRNAGSTSTYDALLGTLNFTFF